jgi:FKBP-type peptidyl-prolyl cis-trans isomerase FklB
MGQYLYMRKPFPTISLVVAVMFLLGGLYTQAQTSTTQTPPAKTSTAKKSTTASTAKTHKATTSTLTLTTKKQKVSYALGMNIGSNLHKQPVDLDPKILARGIEDAMAGGKTLLTEDEMRSVLTEAQAELKQQLEAKMKEESEANKKAGDAFLAANKTKEGVVALPSGLQYKVLTQGTGAKPTASDTVVCNYRGTLIDGSEFDSSYKRGQPATFPVKGVIPGWTEALQLMPVGSKWQLFVPADLAYGDQGRPPQILPNSTLIFEVELLSIQGKDAGKAPTNQDMKVQQ